jgi:hypothetical protein
MSPRDEAVTADPFEAAGRAAGALLLDRHHRVFQS